MNLNNMRYLNVLLTLIVTCVFTISCSKEYCSINAEVNGIKLIKFPQETIGVWQEIQNNIIHFQDRYLS